MPEVKNFVKEKYEECNLLKSFFRGWRSGSNEKPPVGSMWIFSRTAYGNLC